MNQDSESTKKAMKDYQHKMVRQLIVDIDENKWVCIDRYGNESEMVKWERDMIIRGLRTLLY